ncbi:MFS transporter [Streptomyces sp. NPDC001635]
MTPPSPAPAMKRGTIPVFAVATAITVANIYFTQPLLERIALDLGVSSTAAGGVATAGQIGYALGIVAIVPLADRAPLRRVSRTLLTVTAIALLAGALAPSIALLSLATLVLSTTTVVPQIIMPTVASLAAKGQAGRALGAVGTGLTLGALLSRTVSGALSQATGTWRADYFAAALVTACLLFVLPRYMPERGANTGESTTGYLKLLASMPPLVLRHPSLRLSALLGAGVYGAFSSFWATLAFHLSQKPLELGPAAAGLFGLSSVPGALVARYSGRLSDRYGPDTVNVIALVSATTAFLVFLLDGDSLAALVIGCNLLGYGTTSAQIANQTRIFAGPVAVRARLNTLYMFSLFASAAVGSALAVVLFERHGWTAVALEGMAFLALAALILTVHAVNRHGTPEVPGTRRASHAAHPEPAVSEHR